MNAVLEPSVLEGTSEHELLDQFVHPVVADRVLKRLVLPFSRSRLFSGTATLREVKDRLRDNPEDKRYKRFLESYLEELQKFIGEGGNTTT
jgi:hypothetical protein